MRLKMFYSVLKNLGELSDRIKDRLLSYGEQMSSKIVSAFLQSEGFPFAVFQDSRKLIATDSHFGKRNAI